MGETEKKQNYLREEIMDKNYDPELFSEFLASKKGVDALNLELWTFRELQEAVIEFKTKLAEYEKAQAEKEEKEKNYFKEDPYQNTNQQGHDTGEDSKPNHEQSQGGAGLVKTLSKDSQGGIDNDQHVNYDIDYAETVPAKKLPNSAFEQYDRLTISISNVEKNQGSIFSKAFIIYRIVTDEAKLSVFRRYSDFRLFYELLQSIYVGCCIPPIPAKNYGDRFSDSFVNKRKRYLEKFLQALLTIPIVRNSPVLYDFLSIVDEVEFKKSMTKHGDLVKPGFSNYLSHDGLLDLRISKETDTKIEELKANSTQNELLLTRLSFLSKSLYLEIQQVSNRMIEVSEVLNQLGQCSEACKDNETITDLYDVMSKLMKKWSDCEKQKATCIEENIREHFKYIKNEFALMKSLFDKADSSHKNFYKLFKQVTVRKEELFKRGEIRNWELTEEDMKQSTELLQNKKLALSKMLPKRSEELALAKKEYGFFTTSVLSEYKRLRRINGLRYKENCCYLSNANNEMINGLYQMWVDAMMSIASIDFSLSE